MKRCGAVSIASVVAAWLVLPHPSSGSASSTLAADEGSAEQTDESLEELTAERDDLRAQLATKNQEFLVQHSRADRLAAKVAALRRELAAETQKAQGLELRLGQVRSLVDADAEDSPAVASSAPQPGHAAAASHTSASAAPAAAAPPPPPAEGAADASRSEALAQRPTAPPAAGPRLPARVAGPTPARVPTVARPAAAGGPAALRPSRPAPRMESQGPRPAEPRGPLRGQPEPHAALPGGPAAAGPPRPAAAAAGRLSRSALMSELEEQVSQLATAGVQAAPAVRGAPAGGTAAAAGGAAEGGGSRPVAAAEGVPASARRPEAPALPAEQNATNATGEADFDELETQLHEEDRKIDELDRESQEDASFAEKGALQDDEAVATPQADSDTARAGGLGGNASLAAGAESPDDALFFSQLSSV